MIYKLGSLFDGSGGFPLAGSLCGIEPCWASEVEPYPIAVTRERFPNMKHLGDISKINGAEIEPVDIITFGSPCQDLSVAGKRAGLKHEANGDEETTRSGLFMEAVRIIKEMRTATNGKYPRFALWENVPGAFSSNKGEDFRVVCEELIKIVEPSAVMPAVPPKGWNYSDSYVGDGWSLAYRVFDAQYWGVPQRRRRIHLIADFRGECAREILFKRDGLRGCFTQSGTQRQATPADAQGGTGADDREGEGFDGYNGALTGDKAATLGVNCGVSTGRNGVIERGGLLGGRQLDDVAYTLKIRSGCEGGGKGALVQKDKSATLATNNDQYLFQPVIAIDKESFSSGEGFNRKPGIVVGGPCATLQAQGGPHAVCYRTDEQYLFENHSQDTRYKGPLDIAPVVFATFGMGGNNQPLVARPVKESNFIDVEMEVAVRKYEVNTELLRECLRDHKAVSGFNNKEIAEILNRPVTEVEHWFRTDKCFSVPSPDIWFKLKELLGITTTEFDESIMVFEFKGGNYDMRNRIHVGDVAPTLTCGSGNDLHLLPNKPAYCLQGNGIDRADTAGCNGKGWKEDTSYTLNTMDRHGVVYAIDQGGGKSGANVSENQSPTLCTTHGGDPAVCYRQGGFAEYIEGEVGTLRASGGDFGGGSENLIATHIEGILDTEVHEFIEDNNADAPHQQDLLQPADGVSRTIACGTHASGSHLTKTVYRHPNGHYIVRRLTPTECARLQGFADWWGHIEPKEHLTDEELRFWIEVRNTHAAINGKKVQDYTEKQMLTWYNKLWTDSAEYKMWGNGIALPPALYCMQGILFELFTASGNHSNIEEVDTITADEVTDFSDAPEEIKAEIIKNDELLHAKEHKKDIKDEEIMEHIENNVATFNAVAQLKRLADERKALANLKPDDTRFADDVRAIEHAVSVLEAVGI